MLIVINMTTPTTLTDLSGYGWGNLTYNTSDSNYHYYNHSWDTSNLHGVKVKFTTGTGYNVWSDGSSGGDPSVIDDNADGNVYAYNASNQLLIKFLKPTTASWISGTGGGSGSGGSIITNSVLVPSAEIVNGNTFEMRGYATGSYALTSPTILSFQSTWNVTSATNNVQHSVANLAAGTYVLSDSILLYNIVTLYVTNKKVFCNFW